MFKFQIKGEPGIVEVPNAQALVEYLNETAKFSAGSAIDYMMEYARRAVISRDIDIRATDYDSFVQDLVKYGDVKIIEIG